MGRDYAPRRLAPRRPARPVTVTLTLAQADALYAAACRGRDEWEVENDEADAAHDLGNAFLGSSKLAKAIAATRAANEADQ